MIFSDLCRYVGEELRPDGDSLVAIPATGPYFSTRFGLRVANYLQTFVTETLCLYTPAAALTLDEGDVEIDLSDSSKCAKSICFPLKLWLEDTEVRRVSNTEELRFSPMTHPAFPTKWAIVSDTSIHFDAPLPDDYAGYVAGFFRHPAIASDSTPVIVAPERLDILCRYIQLSMREDTASDEIGLARIQRLEAKVREDMSKLRGLAMKRMYNGAVK